MAAVGNTVEGTINNYEAKVEVLIKVYSKVITKKSTIFIRNQITNQLGTPLISKKGHIISSTKV